MELMNLMNLMNLTNNVLRQLCGMYSGMVDCVGEMCRMLTSPT